MARSGKLLRKRNWAAGFVRRGKRFAADTDGALAIIFALLLIPILLAIGAAIDFSNSGRVRTKLADALDSAALAAAKAYAAGETNKAALTQIARGYFDANAAIDSQNMGNLQFFDLTLDEDKGTVAINAQLDVPTYILGLAGINDLKVTERAVAAAANKKIELVMMLDVTGSMWGSKIADLRAAAGDLVDMLVPAGTKPNDDKVRIGLVPYSQGVNAGPFALKATAGKSSKCATERTGAAGYTDLSYSKEEIGDGSNGCPPNVIVPLTANRATLMQDIGKLDAGGSTAGHVGIAWSWYMLSPNWGSLWPGYAQPTAYNTKDTLKIAVLMTDGSFNTYYEPNGSGVYTERYGSSEPSDRARFLCTEMKQASRNVMIYSIAFQAPTSAQILLRDCATSTAHYFDAKSGAELREAFKKIAGDVQQLRLTE